MGIHRLMHLLREKAPGAIKTIDPKIYTGRQVACDASMAIYQFLIATQNIKLGFGLTELKDKDGNLTGHLLGLFNRSVMMLENGIRPVWVFDGKPPEMKGKTIAERKQKKIEAEENKIKAIEEGNQEEALKYANQSVKITKTMIEDAKKLIILLGLPIIEAPSEAEAQCAIMAKEGKVFAVATEDMDVLTFGSPIQLRGFSNKDDPVTEINLEKALNELNLTMAQFIDLCILCGCDYTDSIDGIGPIKAHKLISEHKDIEGVLEYVDRYNKDPSKKKKLSYTNENFLYEQSREIFKNPEVTKPNEIELKWTSPEFDKLKVFLCDEKSFAESRIDSAIKRIESSKDKVNQKRLDNFFQIKTVISSTPNGKRKDEKKPNGKSYGKSNKK
jgi:flap endonuclease-1